MHEMWIEARAKINRGWLPTPRHAEGGRHASGTFKRPPMFRKPSGAHGVRYARMGA